MKTGILFLALFATVLPAPAETITFAISTGSAMPMTQFQGETLSGGLLKDFGDALARELMMEPRYLNLPRKRVEAALASGQADLLCDLRPEWLDFRGWHWSDTVFSNQMIIVSRRDTPPLVRLGGLAGKRVGTVLGYRYPEIEGQIEGDFERDDGASDEVNTTKLLKGRYDYMVSNALYYDYQRTVHPGRAQLSPERFSIRQFDTFCALPPKGRLTLERVNRAILALRRRGEMQHMLDRYRPSR